MHFTTGLVSMSVSTMALPLRAPLHSLLVANIGYKKEVEATTELSTVPIYFTAILKTRNKKKIQSEKYQQVLTVVFLKDIYMYLCSNKFEKL